MWRPRSGYSGRSPVANLEAHLLATLGLNLGQEAHLGHFGGSPVGHFGGLPVGHFEAQFRSGGSPRPLWRLTLGHFGGSLSATLELTCRPL